MIRRIALLAPALAWCQAETGLGPVIKIVKGELTGWSMRGLSGEMAVLTDAGLTERCRVHPDTYLTRQTVRLAPAGVKVGDTVELVADLREGPTRCLALTVYLRPPEPRRRATSGLPMPVPRPVIMDNLFFQRGSLTFAGTVSLIEPSQITVRTRKAGRQLFTVRDDTIFSMLGRVVSQGALSVHTPVFVRAGRTFGGELEAYQIVWGQMFSPKR